MTTIKKQVSVGAKNFEAIRSMLQEIYHDHTASELNNVSSQLLQILQLNNAQQSFPRGCRQHIWDSSSVILITYPDGIYREGEPTLRTLNELIQNKLSNLISVIHVLPFLQSTSDGGFAVSSHEYLEFDFGNWNDLKELSKNHLLMADLILNHVSSSHRWVHEFRQSKLPGTKFILSPEVMIGWDKVIRPRSCSLFTTLSTNEGPKDVWTTFGPDQIDLNWKEPFILIEFLKLIVKYFNNGIRWIRLDAVAFIWKTNGTNCLHREQAHKLVKILRMFLDLLSKSSIIISETNVPEKENLSYIRTGDEAHLAYNFPLPPLLLEALITNKADLVNKWLCNWPELPLNTNFLNFTASHDGVGLRPLEGLMDEERIRSLLFNCEKRGGLVSHRKLSSGEEKPYELNISWWSAMEDGGRDPSQWQIQRFLLSQLFCLCLKGIPAFYLQAILASKNDHRSFSLSGQRRDLNRERFQADSLFSKLDDPNSIQSRIIKELEIAIEIRKNLKCFHPDAPMSCLSKERTDLVIVSRGNEKDKLLAVHNMTNTKSSLSLLDDIFMNQTSSSNSWFDCLTNQYIDDNYLNLNPYSVKWLRRSSK